MRLVNIYENERKAFDVSTLPNWYVKKAWNFGSLRTWDLGQMQARLSLENAFKFKEIPPSWFFHSSFRANIECLVWSFNVGNAGEHSRVILNPFKTVKYQEMQLRRWLVFIDLK